MKTTLEIATDLGIEKHVVASVIKQLKLSYSYLVGNRKMFDDNAVEAIKKHLGIESYIFLSGSQEYQIFESKMNYENTIS